MLACKVPVTVAEYQNCHFDRGCTQNVKVVSCLRGLEVYGRLK